MSHRNVRLTVHGRRILVERVQSGRPVVHVAAEMGISRPTAHKWVRRWRAKGEAGLHDRLSGPHTTPHCTPAMVEAGPADCRTGRDADSVRPHRTHPGPAASTVHRILTRHGINRLAWLDRTPTGGGDPTIRVGRPGELVHVGIKKLGNIPDGGGWRVVARTAGARNRQATTSERRSCNPVIGYSYIHSAVDDHSRLAYSEVLPDERKDTAIAFWQRANAFFAAHARDGRTRPDRQRRLLQGQTLHPDPRRSRYRPQEDPPLPAADQRQGRTLQPDAPGRVGLPAALHLRPREDNDPGRLPPHLQPPLLPHRTRRPTSDQPRQQRCESIPQAPPVHRKFFP